MALKGYYIKPKGFDADSDSRKVPHRTAMLNHCKAAFIHSQGGKILHSSRLTWSEEETFLAELAIR